ncbi:MAG: restriction endonuclease subunit S [Psychrobacter sp.]
MSSELLNTYPKYDSYKESGGDWLGDIPESWSTEKGKWLFTKMDRPIREDDGIITCFRDGEVTLRSNRRSEGFTNALKEHGYQGIREGDLVIHQMDAFAGAIGVSDSNGKSTPVYSVCTPRKSNTVLPEYYSYLLRNLAFSGYILSLAKGIRERSTDFRFNDFAKLNLPLPSIEMQRNIVTFIEHKSNEIDQAIELKQQQIEKLNEYKQIVIQNAVTKGLDPNAKMKDSRINWLGDIPETWDIKKLKFLTSKIGSGVTPSGGATTYIDDGVPLLRSQNIHFNGISLDNVARISESVHNSMSNSKVKKGDVLLNITGGSLGRCYHNSLDIEMNVNQHVCIVRPNDKVDSVFLNYLLASNIGQQQIWFFQQGGGREGLNFQNLKNFDFPLPSKSEQLILVKHIDGQVNIVNKAINSQKEQIERLKEYKTILINQAVTGKIKVS